MNKRLNSLVLAAAFCGITWAMSVLRLDARENETEDREEIKRVVALAPTVNAPTNAIGMAALEVGHATGTNKIEIHTAGLLAGVYTVTVFDRSGANSAVLGTLNAGVSGGGSLENGSRFGAVTNDDNGGDRNRRRGGDSSGDDNSGEADFPLPDSINALELGAISIADSMGAEMLRGDFSDVSSTLSRQVFARVTAIAGAADDDASGSASIRGRMRRGRGTGTFSLTGQNLPPRSTFAVLLNGEDAGTAHTDRHGRLRLHRSQRSVDVLSILTVSVLDDSGGEVLRAQF